jgi:CHASE3 domain sensor protein
VQSSIISSRVTGAFTAVLVIVVLAFVASVHGASRLADLDLAVARARDVVEEIGVTSATLHEVESARRGYFRTRQKPILELYLVATKDAVAHLDRLRDLTSGDPAERRSVDGIRPLVAQQVTLVTDAIASRAPQPAEAEVASPPDDGTILTEQIRGLMAELEEDARARLHDRNAEASARTVKVIRGFGAIALIAMLLLGGAYYLLDRDAAVHDAVLEELRSYTRTPAAPGAPAHDALEESDRERASSG